MHIGMEDAELEFFAEYLPKPGRDLQFTDMSGTGGTKESNLEHIFGIVSGDRAVDGVRIQWSDGTLETWLKSDGEWKKIEP